MNPEEERWNTIELRKFAVLSAIDSMNKLSGITSQDIINTAADIEHYIINGTKNNTNQ